MVQYIRLARKYHPDKYDPTANEISMFEAQEHFKLINNTYNTFARKNKYISNMRSSQALNSK